MGAIQQAVLGFKNPAGGGGSTPPVTTNLILNWDAREVTVADGAIVQSGDWLDLSASANHPVNTSGSANSPHYRATGGPGGLASVEFNGNATNGFFSLTNTIAPTNCTIFAVCKPSDPNPRTLISGPGTAFQYRTNSLKQDILSAGTTLYGSSLTSLSTSVFKQINVTFNNTTRAFAFRLSQASDGSGTGGGSSPAANMNAVGWNEANVSTHEPWLGFISHLLIYNTILSGGDITTMESWLNSEWGV